MSDKEIVCIGGFNITKYKKRAEAEKTLRQEYESEVSSKVLDSLCREFNGWLSYGDTDYLDEAVSLLYANKVPIKGILLDEVGKLANARLSREVKESTGDRKKMLKELLSRGAKDAKREPKAICNGIAFTLIEVCRLKTEQAYRYTSKIFERDYGMWIRINREALGWKVSDKVSDRTVKRYYETFKKSSNYEWKIEYVDKYKEAFYPNMTIEEIKHSLIGDIEDDEL
ncbi:hypothetical protein RB981_003171 [Vibrio cholerae]|nr:hypothetical protein [Vibrio cholerae]